MAAPLLRALLGRAALPRAVPVAPPVPVALPGRGYRAPPPRRSLGRLYRPDPADPRAPRWHLGPRGAARRFGRFGAASGEDPAQLWPSPEQLRELQDEERERERPLRDVREEAARRERRERELQEERAARVARALARMPALVAAWREARAAARGGPRGDPAELERRRDEKRQRRQRRRDEAQRALEAAREAAAAAPPPPGVSGAP